MKGISSIYLLLWQSTKILPHEEYIAKQHIQYAVLNCGRPLDRYCSKYARVPLICRKINRPKNTSKQSIAAEFSGKRAKFSCAASKAIEENKAHVFESLKRVIREIHRRYQLQPMNKYRFIHSSNILCWFAAGVLALLITLETDNPYNDR
ncbi:hypothetical protein AVEN_189317-1 [Araneus ventricosus]|uniref:Transmembrane protein n=1 Tax=Araneus ventricosus TaxID=182803 RepID=A0A4Y2Q825_ARAVE|nr:hypothetical protein AVEN_189317-1 [Araneus ventricosus]